MLKSHLMSIQHTDALNNNTLHDRITYFLNYNIDDSDVSDNVKFVVDKKRLKEILDKLQLAGGDLTKCYDGNDKLRIVPDNPRLGFNGMNIWYHDRLKYFCLSMNTYEYEYYNFIDITYNQMRQTLIAGFEEGIITNITHPCWKF